MLRIASFAIVVLGTAGAAQAQDASGHHHAESPYAGQETRSIKALSERDITDLKVGAGMGLAKAAELNGVPGPTHLLELKDQLGLSADQIAQVEAIRQRMKAKAVKQGEKLIAQEKSLDQAFATRNVTPEVLTQKLAEIAAIQARLRDAHLQAHLETIKVVTPQQLVQYNTLRGYKAADPCANPPAGHDPAMWRKHNRCDG